MIQGRPWHAAAAGLALAVWLVMCAAEACPQFHAWLHGGSVPDNDDCAIAMLAHGSVEVGIHPDPTSCILHFVTHTPVAFVRSACSFLMLLPCGRGPPCSSMAG